MSISRICLLAVVVFASLWLYAGLGGVRGTDQYWYVADVETLTNTMENQTNNVFPVALLSGEDIPPPFVHNILSLYLAAIPALIFGSFWGWLVLNAASTLLCAWLIYQTCEQLPETRNLAPLAGLAYLAFPLTFWQATQPLAEASIAFFVALGFYVLARADLGLRSWLALAGVAGLMYLSRESLLLVLLAVPFGYIACGSSEHGRGWWRPTSVIPRFGLLMAVCLAFVGFGQLFLFNKYNVEMSYARLLNSSVPGHTSNILFLVDISNANLNNSLTVDFGLIWLKIRSALEAQFPISGSALTVVYYWIFNVLALLALVMVWRVRDRPIARRMVWATLLLVGVHAATAIVHQNQFRYLLIPMPGLIIVMTYALAELPMARQAGERFLVIVTALIVVLMMPVQLMLAKYSRDQAAAEFELNTAVRRTVPAETCPGEALLTRAGTRYSLLFGYAVRPRPVLYVANDYTPEEYQRLLDELPSCWLLARAGSSLVGNLGAAESAPEATLSGLDGEVLELYRLR